MDRNLNEKTSASKAKETGGSSSRKGMSSRPADTSAVSAVAVMPVRRKRCIGVSVDPIRYLTFPLRRSSRHRIVAPVDAFVEVNTGLMNRDQ